jgi:opacity protein-like surface antigen
MKLSLRIVLLMTLGLLVPGLSVAELSPYVGADLQWQGISLKGLHHSAFPRHSSGVNGYVGLQLIDSVGLELGANVTKGSKSGASTKNKGLSLSVVGNYPLDCLAGKQLSLLGSAGVSHVRVSHKQNEIKLDYKKLRPKLGLGLQYELSSNLALRALGSWEGRFGSKPLNYTPKNALGASAGLLYQF